jgi:spore coat protein F
MNMYPAPAKALRQDVDKQLQTAQQLQQKSGQFVQQKTGQSGSIAHNANSYQSNGQHQPSHLM